MNSHRLHRIKLEAALAEEADACVRMNGHIAAQRRAILERDPAGLETASQALAAAGNDLRRAAEWRLGLPEEARSSAEHGDLAQLRRGVQQQLADVHREAALNQELLDDALAYLQMTWRTMTTPEATYGRQRLLAREGLVLARAG